MKSNNEQYQRNTMSDMKQLDSLNYNKQQLVQQQQSTTTTSNLTHSQPRQLPQQQTKSEMQQQQSQPTSNKNQQKLASLIQQDDQYQSSLLSRFVKEPRLPPSTNVVNKRKSFGPINKSMRVGGVVVGSGNGNGQRLNMTNYNEQNYHSNQDGKNNSNSQTKKKTFKQPVISYRNQSEIMKKIFGNEQYYNQVKSLFKGPQDDKVPINNTQSNNNAPSSQIYFQNQATAPQYMNRAQSTPHQDKQLDIIKRSDEKRMTMHQQFSSPNQYNNHHNIVNPSTTNNIGNTTIINNITNYSNIYTDKPIIAKSREKLEQLDYNRMSAQSIQNINTPFVAPLTINKTQAQGSDQVEKAIFDLQDVKNNYFQEKSLYDQKIQKIQIKQQNSTIYGNSFLQGGNQTTKTQTGFFNNSGQRPMTQGGNNLFKNHSLINDENILQGDLEKVSKEDLRERLVVAEMVMKKLFQRNKDLEDMLQQSNLQKEEQEVLQEKQQLTQTDQNNSKSIVKESNQITETDTNQDEHICKNCVDLRKELTSKENDMQRQINDLQLQLLEKTDMNKDSNHLQYMRMRLEETMNEAKRHFNNYIQLRNTYNTFLESRLNLNQIQGGMKGQKLQGDILNMLKKNLEQQDHLLQEEQQSYQRSLLKVEQIIEKKDKLIQKRDSKIKKLNEEIDRRQFLENKVQKYVKGIIAQNQKYTEFLQGLSSTYKQNNRIKDKQQIDEFLKKLENQKDYDENEGESTENENEDDEQENSVEINDL